jgi:uncharacterized membrane protein (DUF4010 family)
VLNHEVAMASVRYLVAPLLVGALLTWWIGRLKHAPRAAAAPAAETPLRLGTALQMAAAFQLVLLVMVFVRRQYGDAGVYTSAALFGATDVDALAVAMTRTGDITFSAVAGRAIAVGIASNTVLKLGISLVVGRGVFRRWTAFALAVMLVALIGSVVFLP